MKITRRQLRKLILKEATSFFGCKHHSLGFVTDEGKWIVLDDNGVENKELHTDWLRKNDYLDDNDEPVMPDDWIKVNNAYSLLVPHPDNLSQEHIDGLVEMWLYCSSQLDNIENQQVEVFGPPGSGPNMVFLDYTIPELIERFGSREKMDKFFNELMMRHLQSKKMINESIPEGSVEAIGDSIKRNINVYISFDKEKIKNKDPKSFTDEDLHAVISDENIFYFENEIPDFLLDTEVSETDHGQLHIMRDFYPKVESLKNRQLDSKVNNIYFEKLGEILSSRSSLVEPEDTDEKVKSVLAKRRAHHEEVAKQARKLKLAILNSINTLVSVAKSGNFVYRVLDPEETEEAWYTSGEHANVGRDYNVYRLKEYGRALYNRNVSSDYSEEIPDHNFSLLEKLYIVSRPVNIIFSDQLAVINLLLSEVYSGDVSNSIDKDLMDKALILFEESLAWDAFEYNDNPLPGVTTIYNSIGEIVRKDSPYPGVNQIFSDSKNIFREMKSALSRLDTLINRGGLEIPTFSNLENTSLENSYSQLGIDENMKLTEAKIRKIIRESISKEAIVAILNDMIEKDAGQKLHAIKYAERYGLDNRPDIKIYDIINVDGGLFRQNVSYLEAVRILEPYEWVIQNSHGLKSFRIIGMKK